MHVGLLFYFNFNLVGGGLEMEIIIIIRWLRCVHCYFWAL